MVRSKPMISNLCCQEAEILSELTQDTQYISDIVSCLQDSISSNNLTKFFKGFEDLESVCIHIEGGFDDIEKFNTYTGEEWYKTIKQINKLIEDIDKLSYGDRIYVKNIYKNLDKTRKLCTDIECFDNHTSLFGCNDCGCYLDI